MCNIMLEDSITSSQSNSKKSIREARLKRKYKRKKDDQSVLIDSDLEQSSTTGFHDLLNEFYKDSDNEHTEIDTKSKNLSFLVTTPSAIISNFNPFELEKSLAIADHMFTPQHKPNLFVETQGFVTCSSLPKDSLNDEYFRNVNEGNDINSSYIITESEMLNCCHNVEKILENVTPKKQYNAKVIEHRDTPDKNNNMHLVNSILHDFSQSPLSKEQLVVNTSWQYTPEFRMRRKPLKCYSRKFMNNAKTNLNELFIKDFSQYDDDRSSCSSLSIQEDVTIGEKINNQPSVTNTNNSERLCENLLNLSEYFTQNQLHQSWSDEEQDTNDLNSFTNSRDNLLNSHNMPDLIKDILTLRSIYPHKERYDSYNSNDSFYGFSNKEDEKSYVVEADGSEQDMLNENLNITHDLKICDNRHPNILLTQEDNPALFDWHEDDCHDIFAGINTENVLQQHFIATPNEMRNVEELVIPKTMVNNDSMAVSEISNQNYAFSKSYGFKTASSKAIKVSREAQIMAAKILSKLPDIPAFKEKSDLNNYDTTIINKDVNLFDNSEDYEWNDDCDLFLNIQTPVAFKENTETNPEQQYSASELLTVAQQEQDVPSTSKIAAGGFKTAGGRNVHISKKAQKSVQKLLLDFASDLNKDFDFEEELREIKCKTYEKTHNLETKQTSLSDKKLLDKNQEIQTANIKHNTISKTAQQNVKNILKEFSPKSKQNCYEDDSEKKNNEVKQSNCTYDEFRVAPTFVQTDQKYIGFHTGNDKIINISTKAKQSAQKLLEEFNKSTKENEMLTDIKSLRNDINKRNVAEIKEDFTNVVLCENSFEQFAETNTNEDPIIFKRNNGEENSLKKEHNMGFQNANGKQVLISAKAQQSVEQILQEFKTDLDIEQYETDLKEIKKKIQIKNTALKTKTIQEDNEYANTITNQRTSECTKANFTPLPINSKRKISIDNSDSESPNRTPSVKIFKQNLYCSKSSFAEQSLKSPLASTSHSVILRKNLLTLTKRRKSKRDSLNIPTEEIAKMDKEIFYLNTPIKSCNPLRDSQQSPVTPSLTEFFSKAPQTSTPRINISPKSQDADLKPIIWKSNNDSISKNSASNSVNTTKLSDNLAINITLNSSNPTAKERIGRLKMYGKAPAVSPILIETHHNCRPSGLRRTRSMLKKTEN